MIAVVVAVAYLVAALMLWRWCKAADRNATLADAYKTLRELWK